MRLGMGVCLCVWVRVRVCVCVCAGVGVCAARVCVWPGVSRASLLCAAACALCVVGAFVSGSGLTGRRARLGGQTSGHLMTPNFISWRHISSQRPVLSPCAFHSCHGSWSGTTPSQRWRRRRRRRRCRRRGPTLRRQVVFGAGQPMRGRRQHARHKQPLRVRRRHARHRQQRQVARHRVPRHHHQRSQSHRPHTRRPTLSSRNPPRLRGGS